MAQTLARAMASATARCPTLSLLLPKRLLSATTATAFTKPPSVPILILGRRTQTPLSRAAKVLAIPATRFAAIRCQANRSGNYSPLNSGSNFSDRPPTEMAPLFPGCDYNHWLIVMDKPGGEGATKQQMIDCYIQTMAKVVGRMKVANFGLNLIVYFNFSTTPSELLVNGEIVQRSPERQRRVEPQPQRAQDRPRYNDRTRYVRRRENVQ
ncbi:hypothetical protein TIFTF001_022495 [Ficus carica]|uniref:MORF/ORRM1/DAG-like MORF domain-containing protein n=1 Tax=Ficus carica TaxID=3494 RepID=A0AA88AIR8_FICCA|nr:hypothetical protein TIFTF001_022495 [Ficus carica]